MNEPQATTNENLESCIPTTYPQEDNESNHDEDIEDYLVNSVM